MEQATFDNYDIEKIRTAWAAIGHRIDEKHVHANIAVLRQYDPLKPKDQKPDQAHPTKVSLEERVRSIIAIYPNNEPLNDLDFQFLLTLLENHPDAKKKIGTGITSICLKQNPQFRSTRTFFLTRIDGTSTDFSWVKCLRTPTHRSKVLSALRQLIYPQVLSFKQKFFDTNPDSLCEIRNTPLTFYNSHVDHQPPMTFDFLVQEFLKKLSLTFDQIKIKDEGLDNIFERRLDSDELARTWIEFHEIHAVLRVISAEANLIDVVNEVRGERK